MQRNIAVVFGGISNENEISVITGTMAANVLKSGGETVVPLYISQKGEIYTGAGLADINNFKNGNFTVFPRAIVAKGGIYVLNKHGRPKKFVKIDVAVNCCHGGWGEGGGVCGLFALNGIPLASAGMFESAAFMDKYFTKLILNSLGLGSSIGIELAENGGELEEAVQAAFFYDDGVIAEKFLQDRREINCAAYYSGGKVITSECEEAFTKGDILSYDDKYAGGGSSVLPADIPAETAAEIKGITERVYTKLNMRGIVRFDFIISRGEL